MAPRSSARRTYRKRIRSSHCRQKGPAACRGTKGCKYSSGKKRSFCRKTKNTKRRVGVRTRAMRKQKGGMLRTLMNTMKAMVTPSQTTAGNKVTDSNTGNKPAGGNKPTGTGNKPAGGNKPTGTGNKPAGGNKPTGNKHTGTGNKPPPHAGNNPQKGGRRTHKNKKH
jgi:hypothetical protein